MIKLYIPTLDQKVIQLELKEDQLLLVIELIAILAIAVAIAISRHKYHKMNLFIGTSMHTATGVHM